MRLTGAWAVDDLRLDLAAYADGDVTGTLRKSDHVRGNLRATLKGSSLVGALDTESFTATISGDRLDATIGLETVTFKRQR